jgi:hypothetical protein
VNKAVAAPSALTFGAKKDSDSSKPTNQASRSGSTSYSNPFAKKMSSGPSFPK